MKSAEPYHYALLLLRIVAGIALLYYGSQKMLGVFGGKGFMPTIQGFEQNMGIHPALAICAIFAEFFGSLGLIFGFLTRIAAFGVAVTMFVAAAQHFQAVNLMEAQTYKDFTYPIFLGTIALAILIAGPGAFSVDARFLKKKK